MSKEYQSKVAGQVDTWIERNKKEYESILNKKRSDAIIKIISIPIGAVVILGLIFRLQTQDVVLYAAFLAVAYAYVAIAGYKKQARSEVASRILASNPKLKADYDKELAATTGFGKSKALNTFLISILAIFTLLFVAALLFTRS